MAQEHERAGGVHQPVRFTVAVLTLSDRCARGERKDESGPAVIEQIGAAGGVVKDYALLPDEKEQIIRKLRAWCAPQMGIDLVLTTGGTGFADRDVTPEATLAVVTRVVPGIAECMRTEGYRHNHRAILSRGVCGICGHTLILNLPGSVRGVRESLEAVLDVLPHGVQILKGEARECGERSM